MIRVLVDETIGDEYHLAVLLDDAMRDDDGRPLPAFCRRWVWHGVPRKECVEQAKGLIEMELARLKPPPPPKRGALAGKEFKL